jgi:cysteinyl-tRNA synthetase
MARFWLHVGMVRINAAKMSKSIGNIISVTDAIRKWGTNAIRIYSISGHYSKPLNYDDSSLMACLQKWRQIEVCAYELRFAIGTGGESDEIKRLLTETVHAFESAMEDNMNTALALGSFMSFVNAINIFAADEKLTKDMAEVVMPQFDKFLDILALKVTEPTEKDRTQIEELIGIRNRLRLERRYAESDTIRKKLNDDYSVRLIDHKKRTIWMKVDGSSG